MNSPTYSGLDRRAFVFAQALRAKRKTHAAHHTNRISPAAANGVPDIAASRARYEQLRAQKMELDLLARIGQLVEADKVRAAFVEISGQIRESIMGIPDRIGAELAAETDEFVVVDRMREEIHRSLETLSKDLKIYGKKAQGNRGKTATH